MIAVGAVVVLRNLRMDQHAHNSAHIPPRIAIIVRVLDAGELLVKLHLGGWGGRARWSPRPRRCASSCVVRLATKREEILGSPVGAPVGVREVAL